MLGFIPFRTHTSPSLLLLIKILTTSCLVPLDPCQAVRPGLTPALLNRRQPPTAVTLSQLLGQERADANIGKEVTHVPMHLGGTAALLSA